MPDPVTPPLTEEERRRKIILDSQVSATAARGIEELENRKLTPQQVRELIRLDEEYLSNVERVSYRVRHGKDRDKGGTLDYV